MSLRLPGALRALAGRVDDVRLVDDDARALALDVDLADRTVRVPVRGANEAMVSLATVPLGGFRLTGRQRAVLSDPREVRPELAERLFDFESNDPDLAALWLDTPSAGALVMAVARRPEVVSEGCTIRVSGEHCAGAADGAAVDHVAAVVRATAILATRPYRIARALAPVAAGLGATVTRDRWDLGHEFALLVERRGVAVRLDHTRAFAGELRSPHLRTRVRARRVGGAVGDDWAIWRPDLDPSHRPRHPGFAAAAPPPALAAYDAAAVLPERLADRLRPLAPVIADAAVSALICRDGEVTLWWPGAIVDRERLDRAIEVIARLAVDAATPQGPYR